MRVVALLQARMNSSRLPGKVVRDFNGMPMIVHIWRRLLACREVDEVYIAMGHGGNYHALEPLARMYAMHYGTGPDADLITRLYECGRVLHANAIVRITADCLWHDPKLIDSGIERFRSEYPRSRGMSVWPYRTVSEGLDFEIWSMELLAELDRTKDCPREGFAAWVCDDDDRALKYRMTLGMQGKKNDGEPHLSIDTPEDAKRAEAMLEILGNDEFRYDMTLSAYRQVAEGRDDEDRREFV